MIGVIGATGFTGQLVAKELKNLNSEFFIAARNEIALKKLSDNLGAQDCRLINVQDKSTFSALEGCSVLINCAGPYTDLGEAVVQEAINRRIHYLDLTGEQGFIKLVYDKYHQLAEKAGIVLVPACAFEYAIGDALGTLLYQSCADATTVEIFYQMHGAYTSAGTRKSIVRALSSPGYQFRNGALIETAPAALMAKLEHADQPVLVGLSFPGGEVLMLPRHTSVKNVSTYMAVEHSPRMLHLLARLGLPLIKLFAEFFVKAANKGESPTVFQRQSTGFKILARVLGPSQDIRSIMTGADPYLLTAILVSKLALELEQKEPRHKGAITPAMISGADFIFSILVQSGVSFLN